MVCLNNFVSWQGTEIRDEQELCRITLIRRAIWLRDFIYRSRVRRKLAVGPFEVLLMSRQQVTLSLTTQGEERKSIVFPQNWLISDF